MEDESLKVFSERLRELRSKRGLTQKQFVDGLGITPAALSSYETGEKNPSVSVAIRIAEKYQVSLDWLCGLSDNETGVMTVADCFGPSMSLEYFEKNMRKLVEENQKFMEQEHLMYNLVHDGVIDVDLLLQWRKKALEKYNYPITDIFKVDKTEDDDSDE